MNFHLLGGTLVSVEFPVVFVSVFRVVKPVDAKLLMLGA